MPTIPYNETNLERCRCSTCPVHASSRCVLQHAREVERHSLPDPKRVELEYCSQQVGASSCSDLDGSLQCSCSTCPVWQENSLGRGYFCISGPAQ